MLRKPVKMCKSLCSVAELMFAWLKTCTVVRNTLYLRLNRCSLLAEFGDISVPFESPILPDFDTLD